MSNYKFELTKDHIKLASKMYVTWQDCETGAPAIDPKRPYGNSSVEFDICEILGWKMKGDDGDGPCYSSKQLVEAEAIHLEMEIALQIILSCKTFEPGNYVQTDEYNRISWEKETNKKKKISN